MPKEDSAEQTLDVLNYVEITKNNKYSLKLNIKNQPSPLKLRIDYIDLEKRSPL
jgi:hypothetical protein